jgi:hypothetical protein
VNPNPNPTVRVLVNPHFKKKVYVNPQFIGNVCQDSRESRAERKAEDSRESERVEKFRDVHKKRAKSRTGARIEIDDCDIH